MDHLHCICPVWYLESGSEEEGMARIKTVSRVSEERRDDIYSVNSKGIVNYKNIEMGFPG